MAAASAGQQLQQQQQQHHHQQQQQQQQHKLNIVSNVETVAGVLQVNGLFQQQAKFVTRVATNAAMQQQQQQQQLQQQQQQQQILPAGLVNGNATMLQANNVARLQQQQQQQHRHNTPIFVSPAQLQQQQQQQHVKLRQAQIRLPVKSAATVAATHCMPATIAARQMSQNNQQQQQQFYVKNVAKTNNNNNNNNNNNCNYNLAPGWRRLTNNNEVAYISPTGKTLRSQYQIRDYLLSQGTCKCGLPCPLRPEYFFDFNAEVPNMPMKAAAASTGHEANSLLSAPPLCAHQRKMLESGQAVKDVIAPAGATAAVSNVFTAMLTTTTTTTAAATAATTHEFNNKDAADAAKYGKRSNNTPALVNTVTSQATAPATVIKPAAATPIATPTPTPAAVLAMQPNFKDDPAGYLQQQTALLQCSLNVSANAKLLPQESIVHSSQPQQQQPQQQQQRQRVRRIAKWELEPTLLQLPVAAPSASPNSLHVDTAAAFARPQKPQITSVTVVPAPQESPVSSSAPEQVGAISTSHESPRHSLPSPTESLDSSKSLPVVASPKLPTQQQQQQLRPPPVISQAHSQAQLRLLRQQCQTLPRQPAPQQQLQSQAQSMQLSRSIVTTTASISRPASTVAQLQSMAHANGGQQLIMTSAGQLLVIPAANNKQQQQQQRAQSQSAGYIVGQPKLLHHQLGQLTHISQANGGNPTQTVLLNTLPNGGYIVQQQAAPAEQQQQQQLLAMPQPAAPLITSPESKRRPRKRKNSISSTPPPPAPQQQQQLSVSPAKTLSPQISPSIPSQAPALLQQAANAAAAAQSTATQQQQQQQQFPQQFQLSPGIQGIVVNKPANAGTAQPQQLLLQNGQILQQVNLIGQQLLMPAGLVMGPDATLLQIQNMPTTSLLTPQGSVMLRTPSPQGKPSFISPSTGGQQYLVGANGQLSPIGQIYSTHMGLVMPTAQQGGASFVQASPTATIQIQQQQQPLQQQQQQQQQQQLNLQASYVTETHASRQLTAGSPPDTTTCSPRSPERPPSHRSSGSDMVQYVSSSEPDAAISPQSAGSRQSPSSTDCDPTNNCQSNVFSQPISVYKPAEAKIRRIHVTSQAPTTDNSQLIAQESPASTTEAAAAAATKANKRTRRAPRALARALPANSSAALPPRTFAIGELIWGPARGHPAWPGKIVKMPDGVCTPSQQFDHVWVQWFGGGGRSSSELITVNSLQSLSEGLEAHHKAQKDTRKSRKLNSQLERAIQEAMTELDNISAAAATGTGTAKATAAAAATPIGQQQLQQPTSTNNSNNNSVISRGKRSTATSSVGQALASGANLMLSTSTASTSVNGLFNQQRHKPIRIAPAPAPTLVTAAAGISSGASTPTAELLKLNK
ncbi:transcription factor SPT20 homolog isoform X2 [Drosophila busckii]|uniref:transcription factor SPT20 homolog isoform X2 n=1 Tax=Drosophila busckii TaxID=30019 RepID=UPI00083F02CB|nr:transcription factor SPT20 homolog isoform X2 [Drosophila busckii]